MSKNKQPTRKEIQKAIDGFKEQEIAAQAELEDADRALRDAKLPQIEAQAEVASRKGVLDRAPVYFFEETAEIKRFESERKSAVARVSDIRRRIGLLKKALRITPE